VEVIRICLIHGAATGPSVWNATVAALADVLPGAQVACPQRPSSGSLDIEVETLAPYADGAIVVGVSGGATLGLELAARGVAFTAAVLHEPAVGSLLPDLLKTVADAYRTGGPLAFGAALYGPAWHCELAPADLSAVERDLAMFQRFEPRAPAPGSGPVLITVGDNSPAIRHQAAKVLQDKLGFRTRAVANCRHAIHLEQPRLLADLVAEIATAAAAAEAAGAAAAAAAAEAATPRQVSQ